jgi:hypothetical protein
MLGLAIGAPIQATAGNLPATPITRILSNNTALELSETQVKKLNLVNNNIINQMLQVRAQAQNHKAKIDKAAADWSDLGNPVIKGAVKEYYRCQADMKILELEAMVQASRILSNEQINKFNQLVTMELMMNGIDEEISDAN